MNNYLSLQRNISDLSILLMVLFYLFLNTTITAQNSLKNRTSSSKIAVEEYKSSSKRVIQTVCAVLPMQDDETEFEVELVDELAIYEGDIVLGPAAQFAPNVADAVAICGDNYRWADGVIPYVIASEHPKQAQIQKAIKYVSDKTNLRVIPRTTEADYVKFISGRGCWSYVGRQGGKQSISIGNCDFGSTVHEICHAAGLYHEQSAPNRDNYITVHFENIVDSRKHNFKKKGYSLTSYDKGSLMHYPAYAFSKNGKKTITCKNNSCNIGQRSEMSAKDIEGVNNLYVNISTFNDDDNEGWRVEKHVRRVADVNGDGRADIVGFGNNAVYVALGQTNGTFGPHKIAYQDFTYNKGDWRVEKHEREVADVNGDGRADIVGFGANDVFVALGQENGTFGLHKLAYQDFTYSRGGWRVEKHEREVADVNGDGCADIVGFGANDVFVALGQENGTFGLCKVAYQDFTYNRGDWRVEKHVRRVADVNGDGRADIVGFGDNTVYVALGQANGTFAQNKAAYQNFTYNKGG